ncbi:lipopolysaccharide biosynthesis protein [Microbacterium alcoholitolerans]|uniref:lipopolysaccharide biosynthesis protein n=1 Tax=unclassified Microbacterium TaxID=2609290 RepID=UPI003D177941
MSRTAQSARNAGVSILVQIIVILLGFATRTVFIAQLGVAMVGVNAVLTSLMALLALADLGINGALMYALYKPLREGDAKATAAIVQYAGRLLRWVAVIIAVVGLAAMPFVHLLVQLDSTVEYLELYYAVLLANTVVGYLMLNRLVLLNADQKIYLTKIYSLVFNVVRSVAQILALMFVGSFLLFLVIQVLFTLLNNLFVYVRAGRIYPYIRARATALDRGERASILRSTRAMMIYRIGGVMLSNSTSLLVSLLVGTVALGYYSNYLLIVGAAVMIVEVAFSALTPSVGNLVASGDRRAARNVFDETVLLALLVHGAIAVSLVTLLDDFVLLWLGPEFILPLPVVIAAVLNFYVVGTVMPLWSFRSATGLFRRTQFVMLVTAALCIALSLAFAPVFGLVAVIAAPTVARLVTGAWYEPWLLIRDYLVGRVLPYFGLQLGAFLLWTVTAAGTFALGELVPDDPLLSLLWKALFIAIVFPLVSWAAFRRRDAFAALLKRMQHLAGRGRRGNA